MTTVFGLVPLLGVVLAVRRITGTIGVHLRNKPVTLLPGCAAGTSRLEQILRITDAFMAAKSLSHHSTHVVPPLLSFLIDYEE